MFIRLLVSLLLFALPTTSHGTDCLGPKNPDTFAIYLHGMDTVEPGPQERLNREKLAAIASVLGIGIALPRAKDRCPTNPTLLCWGWNFNEKAAVDKTLQLVTESKAICFPRARSGGLIGFSNGGHAVNRILRECRKTDFKWLISIGAGGTSSASETGELKSCGKLVVMIGKDDKANLQSAKDLSAWLKGRGADIDLIEFAEGHMVPKSELEAAIRKLQ